MRIAEPSVPERSHSFLHTRIDRRGCLIVGVYGRGVSHTVRTGGSRQLHFDHNGTPRYPQPGRFIQVEDMPRGRLYEEGYQLKLSGHETFPLRYGWLKKAFDAVAQEERAEGERSVFHADDAIARFGVGRNMVGSMRHWAAAAGVIADDGRSTTPLGRFLFGEGGLDPYMEDPVTAWLVHWTLCSNPRNTTWFWAFGHYPAPTFDRDAMVRGIERLAREHPRSRASVSTIKSDVACFVRTYVGQPPSAKRGHEDSLESPLTELGLIRSTGKRDGFRFVRGRKPTLGAGMVAYAVHEFWSGRSAVRPVSTARTLSFEALAHEPGSPGRIFVLDENTLADLLLVIDEVSHGTYRWSETAGLKQLIREREIQSEEALEFLARDAGHGLRRNAA